MATFGAEEFVLYDTFPGAVNPNMSEPVNGFDSTHSNNVSTAVFDVGTKIMNYNDVSTTTKGARTANKGPYTCIYAKYVCSTTASDITAGEQVTQFCMSDGVRPFAMTKELTAANGAMIMPPLAVACADMTPNSHGWFWCGGVCPQEDITALDTSAWPVTDGSIAGGQVIVVSTGFSLATMSVDVSDNGTLAVGFAYVADT